VTVHDDDDGDNKSFLLLDSRILCEKATKEVANAIVLALNEFPAAVAALRGLVLPMVPTPAAWTEAEVVLARVDEAGFDL